MNSGAMGMRSVTHTVSLQLTKRAWMRLSCGAISLFCASALDAQPSVARFEIGAQYSHFPSYISSGFGVREGGPSLVLRVSPVPARRTSFEIAYTRISQRPTDQSAAPRLDLLRVGHVWHPRLGRAGRLGLRVMAGGAGLQIDAQEIDCGDFPVCSEWAATDSRMLAAAGGVGLSWHTGRRLALQADARAYLPFGMWTAAGWRPLQEVAIGAAVRF